MGVHFHQPEGLVVTREGQVGGNRIQERQERVWSSSPPCLGTVHIPTGGFGLLPPQNRAEMMPPPPLDSLILSRIRPEEPPDRAIWFPYRPYLPALTFHLECLSQDNDQIPLRMIEWGPPLSIFPTISNEWTIRSNNK